MKHFYKTIRFLLNINAIKDYHCSKDKWLVNFFDIDYCPEGNLHPIKFLFYYIEDKLLSFIFKALDHLKYNELLDKFLR